MQPNTLNPPEVTCSREKAEQIVQEFLDKNEEKSALKTIQVASMEEAKTLLGLGRRLYINADKVTLANCWLVIISDTIPKALKSSWIIGISKNDGTIVFLTSANDEG